jgi:RTX calcium-binding nonapeptide repeat (4 copies)
MNLEPNFFQNPNYKISIRIDGTPKDDVINSARRKDRRLLRGGAGNDTLRAGRQDQVLGNRGNDILDATQGRGRNYLSGGQGQDQLFAKRRDLLKGGNGNDILWAGEGKNWLRGDRGQDQFWIANDKAPAHANWVEDFQSGVDKIGIQKLTRNFTDLELIQRQDRTIIRFQGRKLAILLGVTKALTANDFLFDEAPSGSSKSLAISPVGSTSPVTVVPTTPAVFVPITDLDSARTALTLRFLTDTGVVGDRITRYPGLLGTPQESDKITQLSISFINAPDRFVDVSSVLQRSEFFILNRELLEKVNQRALTDGSYTLYLQGLDDEQQPFNLTFGFAIDTVTPIDPLPVLDPIVDSSGGNTPSPDDGSDES